MRFAVIAIVALALLVVGLSWLVSTIIGQQVLSAVVPAIGILLFLLLLVRLVVGVGRAAAPLGDLVEASRRVEAGELGVQVAVHGPRDLRALGRAFNSMSSRLAADVEDRRRLLADVSHELRTPLTVIQGNLEGMIDGLYPADPRTLERVLAEARHLDQLVDDLRTLALADAGELPLHPEPTDLAALAADAVAAFEPSATSAGVELEVEADPGVSLSVDPRRIRQVIGNLLSNAVRSTPTGGRVTVAVRSVADAVELTVTDTGHGMSADAAARAFDRFWRAGDASGAGLGLGIVRDLVRAHGGEVTLESQPQAGTTVRCRLPRSG